MTGYHALVPTGLVVRKILLGSVLERHLDDGCAARQLSRKKVDLRKKPLKYSDSDVATALA
jgi:hypothetical protein